LLAVGGRRVTGQTYAARRASLEALELTGPAWGTLPSWTGVDLRALLAACAEQDVEGVVAKRVRSLYRSGQRSNEWLKVKTTEWRQRHASRRHAVA
jgi:bifunctional non-homologous end joining protein LigD